MSTTKSILGRLSVVLGFALVVAGLVDLLAYTWGRNSPWPWYVNVAYTALGMLLLFPEKLGLGVGWAKELLPWFKPPAHDRRHDDPPGGEQ